MVTYSLWKMFIVEFNYFTTKMEKMVIYSFLSFVSIFTIILDISFLLFQLLGIAIYLISK